MARNSCLKSATDSGDRLRSTLSATRLPLSRSSAAYTTPVAPEPSFDSTMKRLEPWKSAGRTCTPELPPGFTSIWSVDQASQLATGVSFMALRVAVHGAAGRMGRALAQLIAEAPDLTLAAAVDAPHSAHLGKD